MLIGNAGETNVASSFERAGTQLGWEVRLCEAAEAYQGPRWLQRLVWHFGDRRPTGLLRFAAQIHEIARRERPAVMISTGLTPLTATSIARLKGLGIRCLHYSTDDPWNQALMASWFLRSLPGYDHIFTTRRSNLRDFAALGCSDVSYLPFGYDPELSFGPPRSKLAHHRLNWDVLFIGGADADRIAFAHQLISAGVRLALFGDYWERVSDLRTSHRGRADVQMMRQLTRLTPINLCLCRWANRDGHVMRTFEIAAIGGFMLAEDTAEHRDLFGPEGECVLYFANAAHAVEKIGWALIHVDERERMSSAAQTRITRGANSYKDRLITMLDSAKADRCASGIAS